MDSIMSVEFVNNYRSAIDSDIKPIDGKAKFFWLNDTDWAYNSLQLGGFNSIEEVYEEHGAKIFIKMDSEDIGIISRNFLEKHKVYLKVDEDYCCIKIKFDNEVEWHEFPHLDSNKQQYKILDYAANKKPNKVVKKNELNKGCGIKITKSLKKVFQDNGGVKALIPFLIELNSDSIKIKNGTVIEPETYNDLKIKLRIK